MEVDQSRMMSLTSLSEKANSFASWPPGPEAGAVVSVVGGKAYGLAALHRTGLRVPPTWVIPVGGTASSADLARLSTVARQWAVRSSTTVEDGASNSHAGVYESRLGVATGDLSAAIAEVRSSVFSTRAESYRTTTALAEDSGIAVVLQPFVEPISAGVWIGRDVGGGRLEWVTGRGERLVSGHCVPTWEEWPAGGDVLRAGPVAVGAACLDVQARFDAALDLEFAVLPSGLTWLQCRPVTGSAVPRAAGGGAEVGVLTGIAASSGEYTGVAAVLDDPDDERWRPGAVLVTEHTDPDWVPLMTEAGAVVTASGGALCHAAIIARELGVPCVTGVAGATTSLHTGMSVSVDGTNGRVRVLP